MLAGRFDMTVPFAPDWGVRPVQGVGRASRGDRSALTRQSTSRHSTLRATAVAVSCLLAQRGLSTLTSDGAEGERRTPEGGPADLIPRTLESAPPAPASQVG